MYHCENVNTANVDMVAQTIITNLIRKTGAHGWLGFNMAVFCDAKRRDIPDQIDTCGTVGCIAGWATLCEVNDRLVELEKTEGVGAAQNWFTGLTHQWRAQAWLNLDDYGQDQLFYGKGGMKGLQSITPQETIACLLLLKETGVVDWAWAQTNPWSGDGNWNTDGDVRIAAARGVADDLRAIMDRTYRSFAWPNAAASSVNRAIDELDRIIYTLQGDVVRRETYRRMMDERDQPLAIPAKDWHSVG